jgi:hypothetical protein
LALAAEADDRGVLAECLETAASLACRYGHAVRGTRLLGAASALRESMDAPMQEVYRRDFERAEATARSELGEDAFVAAWDAGGAMSLEQVLAEALALREERRW